MAFTKVQGHLYNIIISSISMERKEEDLASSINLLFPFIQSTTQLIFQSYTFMSLLFSLYRWPLLYEQIFSFRLILVIIFDMDQSYSNNHH